MIAISIIDNLNSQISNFLNGKYEYDYLPDKEFVGQLDDLYKESTEGVIRRLKHYLLLATKDECDEAKSRLATGLALLQNRLKTLRFYTEDVQLKAKEGVDGVKHLQAKVKFCERVGKFYKHLIAQVEDWSEGALSKEESEGCFFFPLKKEFTDDDLSWIYENLAARRWIDDRQTSEGDFIYFFSGRGLIPTHPIKWMKSNPALGILLCKLTEDGDKWSKTTAIFTHYSNKERCFVPIGRKTLETTHRNSKGTESYEKQLRAVEDTILTHPDEQMRRAMSRWQ